MTCLIFVDPIFAEWENPLLKSLYRLSATRRFFCGAIFVSFCIGTTSAAAHPRGVERPVASAALRGAQALDLFYQERRMSPFWLAASNEKRAEILLDVLDAAPSHGLSSSQYRTAELRRRIAALTARTTAMEVISLDRALSAAFLLYADDVSSGAVDPDIFELNIYVEPIHADPVRLLRDIAQASSLRQAFENFAPQDPRYSKLRTSLIDLMAQSKSGGWGAPVLAESLSPGDASPPVEALRRRLIAMGDMPPEPELALNPGAFLGLSAAKYDDRLQDAVAKFQDRHGLISDGVAGPKTLRQLNQPIERRIAQVMLNLERMRWRSRQKLGRRIEVNQAAFRMTVYDGSDTPLHEARVIIGKPESRLQTPEFSHKLSYLVFNPTWTVPKSIITREILPEVKADPLFFERNNMVLSRRGMTVDPATIDWAAMTPEIFAEFGVVQMPGPGNALGNVKFMFPNRHSIYLHDTPSKHLFASSVRAFSHGCVRIERPFALAWLLLSEQSANPGKEIESILATGEETEVPLERPIPIHLTYMTSWVDHAGVLNFRDDVYGRDKELARALHTRTSEGQLALGF